MLLGDIVSGNARRIPDGVAWRYRDGVWTWAETNARINRLASRLPSLGLQFQDRVAILANNSNRLIELIFALAKRGIVAVPLAPRSVWREIEYVVNDVGAKAIWADASLAHQLDGAPGGIAALSKKLALAGMGDSAAAHGLPHDHEALIAAGDPAEPEFRFSPDAMRTIRFTSGTTGQPKGCIGSHRTLMANLFSCMVFCPPVRAEDRCLMPVSIANGFGLNNVAGYAMKGAETVLAERFEADTCLNLIERHRITRMAGVPTMIALMTEAQRARPRDVSSLAMFGYTGSPAAVRSIAEAMETLGCDFYQGYGSTETGGRVTYLSPEDHRATVARHRSGAGQSGVTDAWGRNVISAGRELPGFEIRLLDAEGRVVPRGEVGEMMVLGDSTFPGYWNRPEATAEVMRGEWLLTGDLAVVDPDGYYYIVDRKRDMIVTGGYNVYSVEVETVLMTHPDVAEAAVFGVRDATWGEAVVAAVTARPGASLSAPTLVEYCRAQLASYKVPRRVELVQAMPRTSTGKIRKIELREQFGKPAARPPA